MKNHPTDVLREPPPSLSTDCTACITNFLRDVIQANYFQTRIKRQTSIAQPLSLGGKKKGTSRASVIFFLSALKRRSRNETHKHLSLLSRVYTYAGTSPLYSRYVSSCSIDQRQGTKKEKKNKDCKTNARQTFTHASACARKIATIRINAWACVLKYLSGPLMRTQRIYTRTLIKYFTAPTLYTLVHAFAEKKIFIAA